MADQSNTAPLSPDAGLDDLVTFAEQVFGDEVVSDARDRAIDRASSRRDDDLKSWAAAFHDAWRDELQRLLRVH